MAKNKDGINIGTGGSMFLFIISIILVFLSILVVLAIMFYDFPKIANKITPPSSYLSFSDNEFAADTFQIGTATVVADKIGQSEN